MCSSDLLNNGSDYRLKENISDMTDGIERVKQLQPKKFSFLSNPDKEIVDGFLAHEVKDLVPYSVSTNLLLATREIVDSSNPVNVAISFSFIGAIFFSSPDLKYSDWIEIIASMVFCRVCCRCLMASINHFAPSSFCLINSTVSFCFLSFSSPFYGESRGKSFIIYIGQQLCYLCYPLDSM